MPAKSASQKKAARKSKTVAVAKKTAQTQSTSKKAPAKRTKKVSVSNSENTPGDSDDFGGGEYWDNPHQLPTGNTTVLLGRYDESGQLVAWDFGFGIDSSKTIQGIEVKVTLAESPIPDGYECSVSSCYLTKSGNSSPATVNGLNDVLITGGELTAGSSTDLWGTTWSPSEINSSDFGVILQVERYYWDNHTKHTVTYSQCKVKVYYN